MQELNAKQKPFIWKMIGGSIRYNSNLVDAIVEEDVEALFTVKSAA